MSIRKILGKLDAFIPDSMRGPVDLGTKERNYRQLKSLLMAAMLGIAMVPLLMVAGLSYYYYKDLLQKSEREQLEWQLDGATNSIEHMVDSLKSAIQFTTKGDRYGELLDQQNLEELLSRMQYHYGFFADLGVIDANGIQQAYSGPYGLTGTDYHNEKWFRDIADGGVHISRVTTGFRKAAHFAVAVSAIDPVTRQVWVLRATIDSSTLQKFIDTIKTAATDDVFLVDDEGILQTSSRFYGETLSRFSQEIPAGIRSGILDDGANVFEAIGIIEDTPWSVVILKKHYLQQEEWQDFRKKLFLIVFSCMLAGILVVVVLVEKLTDMIKKTDELQLTMLKEAEHTNKLASIGRLAAGVGHEINNPLAIIDQKSGLIEDLLLMGEDFQYKGVILKNLEGINTSVGRCKTITHRLLGFARRGDNRLETLQVCDVLTEVLQFLENSMVKKRITVDLQKNEDLPLLRSDKFQLQQIFLNIINNAIDAIGEDGLVSINSYVVAGDIRVVIQDDGAGMSEEVAAHIFEPFFTTKEQGKGTGLGLSITYGLVKKLGGDITVRSQVGKGTAFTITLPINNESV
ncbi:sensor histidine kinase [Desulfosediminicola ganghwensis]|uniref:sensor histidine kinase n=1 Tax=Desulfosediminicola ganghwensis TaxID=2569540 RepID=UPI0010ABFE59|nr:sensor histidine kinase [Desulfosediminicola ganghwensis]